MSRSYDEINEFLNDLQVGKSSNFEIRYASDLITKEPPEVKTYKPDRKIIDFLEPLEVKRFKVAKLIGKYREIMSKDIQYRIKSLTTRPLSEKACNFFLTYFKEKGVIK